MKMKAETKNETLGNDLISKLHEQGVFKLGTFTLKSGLSSPIYIDLRVLISSPPILKLASHSLCGLIKNSENPVVFDYILGVPYAALPLATLVCAELDAPMLLRRKEAKDYGTKKLIEGVYESGKTCLIIEDVVTSGSSIVETIDVLEKEGLKVTDVLVVLDRQQGGVAALQAKGITVHSVMTMDAILNYLVAENVVDDKKKDEIVRALTPAKKPSSVPVDWSLSSRLNVATNPLTKKLMEIMLLKKTNLCVAADFTTQEQILKLAAQVGAFICMLKLHVDIISDFSTDFIDKLTQIANDNNFLIFEDRKLADTGKTVELQLTKGVYSISSWAHLVTVHSLPGQSVLQGLASAVGAKDSALGGCLLIAQLSTQGTLTANADYLAGTLKLAKENAALVCGYICQRRCSDDPSVLYFTPGVHMGESGDQQGQQWRPPHEAIVVDRNDIVIVGRGVTQAADPVAQVVKYQHAAWNALQERDKD